MSTDNKQANKKANEFAAFVADVAEVMKKHKVEDMLCIFELNDEIRNTYIPLSEKGEDELFCNISDGIHQWLQLVGHQKTGTPKHTAPIKLKGAQSSPISTATSEKPDNTVSQKQ
jgi:hypothetical protein